MIEKKAIKWKAEKTEAKDVAQMKSRQNAIARICHEERKRGER